LIFLFSADPCAARKTNYTHQEGTGAFGMVITEDRTADVLILGLSGKLDATTAKTFEDKILAEIEAGDRRLMIDLSRLDYVSSAGLRVFLVAAKRMRSKDGKIALCSLQDHVQQVFDLSGFSSILSIYASREDGIKAL
jgi:stage II sporulation protein AA (anti-sigma F factor antagonist)